MAYIIGYVDIEEGVDTGLSSNAKIREAFTNTQTAINGLDNRANILEAFKTGYRKKILVASSIATAQNPTATGTALKIEYGPAQNAITEDAMIDVNGKITFNVAGTYQVQFKLQYGRNVVTQPESILAYRWLSNGTQAGKTVSAKLATDVVSDVWQDSFYVVAVVGDTLVTEILRDSAGNDSGGLIQTVMNAAGWGTSETASLELSRLV